MDDDSIVSIRDLLILEGARGRNLDKNIWINDCIKRIHAGSEKNDKIVIADFRFPNEYFVFKERFGDANVKCVRIIRQDVIPDDLESEHLLDNFIFDKKIHNNGGIDDLYSYLRHDVFF